MTINIIILVLTLICTGVIIVLAPKVVQFLKDNKIPVDDIINATGQVADVAKQLVDGLNIKPGTKATLDIIIQAAQIAVKYAEQLYISGQCTKEERKQKAIDFVKMALSDAKIPVDSTQDVMISAIVEAAVFILPKTEDTLKSKAAK